jgi:3',5'-cyclic AMP phosphodiesterase CpdA
MLIAQITDLHLGFDADGPDEPNARRLAATLEAILAQRPRPDLLLVTGDLTERGAPASYRRLKQMLAQTPIPACLTVGNHDDRAAFRAVFPDVPHMDDYVQYVADHGGVRLVVLDTLEEGRHGGGFCAARAGWLAARLAESDRPTLLVLHHPPIETGVAWMTTDPREPWVRRLAEAVAGHPQVRGLVCGHIHRPIATVWRGLPLAVCPAVAPQVALDFTPIDPDAPDERPMVVDEPPGFSLHRITAEGLASHFATVGPAAVLARYGERMQPLVRRLAGERPK